jgi:hypothetical protein
MLNNVVFTAAGGVKVGSNRLLGSGVDVTGFSYDVPRSTSIAGGATGAFRATPMGRHSFERWALRLPSVVRGEPEIGIRGSRYGQF